MFFRFSAHRKSIKDSLVSGLSNIILSDWLSLILGEFKIKSIKFFCCSFSISHLQHCEQNQNFLVQSRLFLVFVPISVFFLEVYFVIVKLSTELKQTVLYYVNRLMLKGAMIDINCNPLVELKIILLLCPGVLFVLVLKFLFDILLRLLSEDLEALLLISLLNTRSETE